MSRDPLFERKTALAYKTKEKTVLRGYNLSDLAEEGYSFSDAMFVLFQGRIPTEAEEKMLTYEMGSFLEHSMSPSAGSAIAVTAGRPNLPTAVAAGVMTFGGVHGPGAAHGYMMNKYLERGQKEGKSVDEIAKELVDDYMDAGMPVIGAWASPSTATATPAPSRSISSRRSSAPTASTTSCSETSRSTSTPGARRKGSPTWGVNVVGAGNAALSDLGFAPNAAWCIGSVSRGYSCAAHAVFQMKKGRAWAASRSEPMVQMLDLSMIKYAGPDDRPVPGQEERQEYAKAQKASGEFRKWVL